MEPIKAKEWSGTMYHVLINDNWVKSVEFHVYIVNIPTNQLIYRYPFKTYIFRYKITKRFVFKWLRKYYRYSKSQQILLPNKSCIIVVYPFSFTFINNYSPFSLHHKLSHWKQSKIFLSFYKRFSNIIKQNMHSLHTLPRIPISKKKNKKN